MAETLHHKPRIPVYERADADGFSLLPKLQPLPAIIFGTPCDVAVKAVELTRWTSF